MTEKEIKTISIIIEKIVTKVIKRELNDFNKVTQENSNENTQHKPLPVQSNEVSEYTKSRVFSNNSTLGMLENMNINVDTPNEENSIIDSLKALTGGKDLTKILKESQKQSKMI